VSLRQTSPCGPGLRVIAFPAALRPVNCRVRPTVNCRFGSSNSTRACGFAALPVLLSPLTWPVVTFTPPQSLGLNLLRFNGSTLGSDYSPHSLRPTSGIWRFSDPLLVVAAGCCCVVCAQSDSPIRSRIVLSTCVESSTVYRRIVRPNHRPLGVVVVPSSSPCLCNFPPHGVGSSSPVLLDRPPASPVVMLFITRSDWCQHAVVVVVIAWCCRNSFGVVNFRPISWSPSYFLVNGSSSIPVNFNLRFCTRCTRANGPADAAFNFPTSSAYESWRVFRYLSVRTYPPRPPTYNWVPLSTISPITIPFRISPCRALRVGTVRAVPGPRARLAAGTRRDWLTWGT
jgi:hypothetical protein